MEATASGKSPGDPVATLQEGRTISLPVLICFAIKPSLLTVSRLCRSTAS